MATKNEDSTGFAGYTKLNPLWINMLIPLLQKLEFDPWMALDR